MKKFQQIFSMEFVIVVDFNFEFLIVVKVYLISFENLNIHFLKPSCIINSIFYVFISSFASFI
ncbi:hypothetical protein C1646_686017 [Rhizophagus diaphanus]|nr:hypothetical protein C1646_686017 [Rhizophagus diaphanus] [Rhizophagus sp. MUCL 43196]